MPFVCSCRNISDLASEITSSMFEFERYLLVKGVNHVIVPRGEHHRHIRGSSLHSGIEFGRIRTGEWSSGGRKRKRYFSLVPLSSCRCPSATSRAVDFDLRLTRVAILSKFFNALSARYLSTLLGLKSGSFRPRLEHAKPKEASKARPDFDPLN
jgi:hypothetical protein